MCRFKIPHAAEQKIHRRSTNDFVLYFLVLVIFLRGWIFGWKQNKVWNRFFYVKIKVKWKQWLSLARRPFNPWNCIQHKVFPWTFQFHLKASTNKEENFPLDFSRKAWIEKKEIFIHFYILRANPGQKRKKALKKYIISHRQ